MTTEPHDDFEVRTWNPEFAEAFRDLNLNWIEEYFEVEETDRKQLLSPQESIIDRGGEIFFGLIEGRPVATCALQYEHEGVFELAKMAVDRELRGKGIGRKLLNSVLHEAKRRGIQRLVIVSNTRLASAIHLYKAVGFQEVPLSNQEYERADIELHLDLKA